MSETEGVIKFDLQYQLTYFAHTEICHKNILYSTLHPSYA